MTIFDFHFLLIYLAELKGTMSRKRMSKTANRKTKKKRSYGRLKFAFTSLGAALKNDLNFARLFVGMVSIISFSRQTCDDLARTELQ